MAELFTDVVEIQNGSEDITIRADANDAQIRVGASGSNGQLLLFDGNGNFDGAGTATVFLNGGSARLRMGGNGQDGWFTLEDDSGQTRVEVLAADASAAIGGNGAPGHLWVSPAASDPANAAQSSVELIGEVGNIRAGSNGTNGGLLLEGAAGEDRIRLLGADGNGWFGGNGADGDLVLFPSGGDNATLDSASIHLDGSGGSIRAGDGGTNGDVILRNTDGADRIRLLGGGGNGWFGGNGADGDLVLFPSGGDNATLDSASIHLDGSGGTIRAGDGGTNGDLLLLSDRGSNRIRLFASGGNGWFGGNGQDGDLVLFPSDGDNATLEEATIHLDGGGGNAWLGGNGADGDIILQSDTGQDRIRLDAGGGNGWFGGNGADGDIVVFPASGDNQTLAQATIHINGDSGDIILQNADMAEDFEVADPEGVEPGTVMVITDDGVLEPSRQSYDRCVAGIVAGAGDLRPGIVLGRRHGEVGKVPIALMGRVWCKAIGPIERGDLLTTSGVAGHAMSAHDPSSAFGSVIGKALGSQRDGSGLVPVLVALQ